MKVKAGPPEFSSWQIATFFQSAMLYWRYLNLTKPSKKISWIIMIWLTRNHDLGTDAIPR